MLPLASSTLERSPFQAVSCEIPSEVSGTNGRNVAKTEVEVRIEITERSRVIRFVGRRETCMQVPMRRSVGSSGA